MESITIQLKDAVRFDEVLELSRPTKTPEFGDLGIITKPQATKDGNSAVMVTFTVMIDEEPRRVQAVTTVRSFLDAADAVRGAHGE